MILRLRSPTSGLDLRPDAPCSLTDGRERWPVIDGIPYLRAGRRELAEAALDRLDEGDGAGGLALLLADQDDWWDGAPPTPGDLRTLIAGQDHLSLRDAMRLLGYGRVGDYFAHRWTDPTYLAGLALLEAHWTAPRSAFELACGIGHYGRDLMRRGVTVIGADVVFSKLWLARRWVLGDAPTLVCFDAAQPWPLADVSVDLALCHDAFYFLEPKAEILDRLRSMLGPGGVLALGHIHNREAATYSAGAAVSAEEIAALFPDGVVYDDSELTAAGAQGRAPRPRPPTDLRAAEAFSVTAGPGLDPDPRPVAGMLSLPEPGSRLRRNPLYRETVDDAVLTWPSERYRAEYGPLATYPARSRLKPEHAFELGLIEAARRRELVNLPERW